MISVLKIYIQAHLYKIILLTTQVKSFGKQIVYNKFFWKKMEKKLFILIYLFVGDSLLGFLHALQADRHV